MNLNLKRRQLEVLKANPTPARWNSQSFANVREEDQQEGLELLVAYHDCYSHLHDSQHGVQSALDHLRYHKAFYVRAGRWTEEKEQEWRDKLWKFHILRRDGYNSLRKIRRRLRKLGVLIPVAGPGGNLVPELRYEED